MREARFRAGLEVLAGQYDVRAGDGVFSRTGYLAGDDERRAAELDEALRDPDVRAVFIARGGYGVMRILDRLDPGVLAADPKPIVGFSDATALLCWAIARAGVCAVHGPVVTQLGELPAIDQQALFDLLADPAGHDGSLTDLVPLGAPQHGALRGQVVGGNLSLLAHLVGTPYFPELGGRLLFLEDIGERPYQVDRYLTHLYLAGHLSRVAGVILGDFTDCCEPPGNPPVPDVLEVIGERLSAAGVPALRGVPAGHGDRNRALLLGAAARFGSH